MIPLVMLCLRPHLIYERESVLEDLAASLSLPSVGEVP